MKRSRGGRMIVVCAIAGMFTLVGMRAPIVSAQMSDSCLSEATIASLQACVQHAAGGGFIGSQGVTGSLLAKLDAAQAALDRGQPSVAVHLIQSFMREVSAQSGQHIDVLHAEHMIAHAQLVIQALEEPAGE